MISNFGYYNVLRKKTNLNVSYIPLVTIGIQISCLFLAGLFNVLLYASIMLHIMGILLFTLDMCRKKWHEYKAFGTASYGYMGACVVALFGLLWESIFFNSDDFSHWATLVQEMLASNHYPNYQSTMITFQTYPLGSATYIYYCCLLAGTEESTMMLSQGFMMVCAIMPMFSCVKKQNLLVLLYMLFFSNFALVYVDNIYLASLMVDSLLALFSMGSFLIIWNISTYSESLKVENTRTDIWVAGPLLTATVMIKNSAIFFVLPSVLVLASAWRRSSCNKKAYAAGIAMPIVSVVLWKQHCSYVFANADNSKHAVSIVHYAEQFRSLPEEFIRDTGEKILKFMLGHPAFLIILLILLAILAADYLFNRSRFKKSLQFSAMVLSFYLLYIIGVYGMYLFSMPAKETADLLEIERYVETADLAAFYVITAYTLHSIRSIHFNRKMTAAFLTLIFLWGGIANWRMISGRKQSYARQWFETQIQQYQIPLGTSCLLCNSDDIADGYLRNIISYLLWSPDIYREDDFEQNDLDALHRISYLIMFDYQDEGVTQWIQKNYPDQYGNAVIVTEQAQKQ